MFKKASALALALCVAALALAGCGGGTSSSTSTAASTPPASSAVSSEAAREPVTLEFLFGSKPMMEWFEEYFPDLISGDNADNITVVPEFQKEATQILQMKAATNELPDMMNLGAPQEMVNQGKFLDLGEGPWWDNTFDNTRELATDVQSGNVYQVPMGSTAVGIFYNKDILSDLGITPPETWDDFVAALEKVKAEKPGVTPMYMGGKDSWSLGHIMEFTLMGVAKQELGYVDYERAMAASDLEALGWNEDADGAVSVFAQRMMELKEKGLTNDNVVTATTDNLADAFVKGEVAFASQGMWALAAMQEKNPEFKSIGFMPYPSVMEGTKPTVGGPLDGFVLISASSAPEKIEAAKIVLERMTSADAIKSYCEKNGSIPVRSDVDADWSFIKDDVKAVLSGGAQVEMFSQNLPGAFNSDEYGRLMQNIFVDKYAAPTDFAVDYLNMWNSAYAAANQ